jgi:hypothetical protein
MANQYVVPSKDVEIRIKLPDIPSIPIETGTSLNLTYSQTVQDIFAIGASDPIDIQDLNAQYTAQLSFQSGEYQLILDAINGGIPAGTAPYATLNQVPTFTLSKVTKLRNATIPKTVTESLMNCKVETNSSDTNRNDAETLTSVSLRGVGIQRTVAPIAL